MDGNVAHPDRTHAQERRIRIWFFMFFTANDQRFIPLSGKYTPVDNGDKRESSPIEDKTKLDEAASVQQATPYGL